MSHIYLDYNATTPLDPAVLKAMMPYLQEEFGNPASNHAYGWKANAAVTKARRQVATLIGAKPAEIIFTSGATESNNMAVLGVLLNHIRPGSPQEKIHIIASKIEHKCLLESCRRAEEWGAEITYLDVDAHGAVDPAALLAAIRPHTRLVSLIYGNNEIGTINPMAAIGKICKEHGLILHSDAAQAFGKIPMHMKELGIDLLSISAHKVYGPKGAGALYVREGLALCPIIVGGGQERGLRSGTLNVPGIVGTGMAAEIAGAHLSAEAARLCSLRQLLWSLIHGAIPRAILNGHPEARLPGNLSVSIPGLTSELIEREMEGIAFSSTSACASGAVRPSHVLKAIGRSDEEALTTLRFGVGRFTTDAEVRSAAAKVAAMCGVTIA